MRSGAGLRDAFTVADHLVFAAPVLEDAIDAGLETLGVRAAPGGRHPRWGTHNALLSLGAGVYLELIAPDPGRGTESLPSAFGLDAITAPRLVTWAVRSFDIERDARDAREHGIPLGGILVGRRERPGGGTLTWRLTDPEVRHDDGIVPFLIDWGGSLHPAGDAPDAGVLVDLRATHPDPEAVCRHVEALGVRLEVTKGPPGLVATVRTERGDVAIV